MKIRKRIRRYLSILLVTVIFVTVVPINVWANDTVASGDCGDNLTWVLDSEGTLTVSGAGSMTDFGFCGSPWFNYSSYIKKVVIESGVTSIGSEAFATTFNNLIDVIIGNSVTTIGDHAFDTCASLISVNIPESVIYIGDYAFQDCPNLASINIPASVTSIGDCAFQGCEKLTGIYVDENNVNYSSDVAGVLFDKDKYRLLQAPGGLGDAYAIPDNVKSIGDYAFSGCDNLTRITISSNVSSIGWAAFNICRNLTDVYYRGTETEWSQISIGGGNNYLKNATIHIVDPNTSSIDIKKLPNRVLYAIGENFDNTGLVLTVTYSDGSTEDITDGFTLSGFDSTSVGNKTVTVAYNGFTKIFNVTVKEGIRHGTTGDCIWVLDGTELTISGNGAMGRHSSNTVPWGKKITSVTIQNGVTSIGDNAFSDCLDLAQVRIANSVTKIGNYAFCACQSLERIVIPDSVVSIGGGAFKMSRLASARIPASVTSIGHGAFGLCYNLHGIYVDQANSVYSSDDLGFLYDKEKKMLIQAPNFIYSAGRYFESYAIPDGVITICSEAFYPCESLTSITISTTVTTVEESAFDYCNFLENIYYRGNESERSKMLIGKWNSPLTDATWYYNSCIESVGHAYDTYSQVITEPTCTEQGYTTYVCSVCGDSYVNDYTEALGHKKQIVSLANSPTYPFALEEGVYSSTNKEHNTSSTFMITASVDCEFKIKYKTSTESNYDKLTITHNSTVVVTVSGIDATWKSLALNLNKGDKVYIKYSKDGSVSTGEDTVYFELAPHTISTDICEPGCEDGVRCDVCKEVVKSATGHKYDYDCDTNCNVCGVFRPVQHKYSAIVIEPTCTEEGYTTYTCNVCGDTYYSDEISALGHSYIVDVKEPICIEEGYTVFTCETCGWFYIDNYTDATGVHIFENGNCIQCNGYLESDHEYTNLFDKTWSIYCKGMASITLTFSTETFVEEGWDFIYIYDANDKEIGKYTGAELASKSITVLGDTVKIRLKTDRIGTAYGFKLTDISVVQYDIGDFNGDSTVDVRDLVRMKKCLLGFAESTGALLDFDNSGDTTVVDLELIRQFLIDIALDVAYPTVESMGGCWKSLHEEDGILIELTYDFIFDSTWYGEPLTFGCGEWDYFLEEDLPEDYGPLDEAESIVWNGKRYYRCGGGLVMEGTFYEEDNKIVITDYYSDKKQMILQRVTDNVMKVIYMDSEIQYVNIPINTVLIFYEDLD